MSNTVNIGATGKSLLSHSDLLLTINLNRLTRNLILAVLAHLTALTTKLVLLLNMAPASNLASELVGHITMVIVEAVLQFMLASLALEC